ncbi:unnamed protein product, partial [Amoebophrya sp. A25]
FSRLLREDPGRSEQYKEQILAKIEGGHAHFDARVLVFHPDILAKAKAEEDLEQLLEDDESRGQVEITSKKFDPSDRVVSSRSPLLTAEEVYSFAIMEMVNHQLWRSTM